MRCSLIINIDRSCDFNPGYLDREEWPVWRGQPESDGLVLDYPQDRDRRAFFLEEFELDQAKIVSLLNKGERNLPHEEWLLRLKERADLIRMDSHMFLFFWENPALVPDSWRVSEVNGQPRRICFEGTIFRNPERGGLRCVLCLVVHSTILDWDVEWLGAEADQNTFSAVLEIPSGK